MEEHTQAYPLLSTIEGPGDMKSLGPEELRQLSDELRQYIIEVVSSNPGHFGASLGVVELSVALHHVFNAPYDQIIWDVGHQAYGHKILTGRRDIFHTNRKYKGISGFPKRSESPYDAFGVGHSSTSVSAALGMSAGNEYNEEGDRQVVAVIGDGALTGGMAYEALNHAGHARKNMLVILNDNNMAIDPNVGAMKEYLLDITTSRIYNNVKNDVWNLLGSLNKLTPNARNYAQKIENAIKSIILKQSNLFESLNFRYFGPVDGHDVLHLTTVLQDMKNIPGPKLLHVITQKGKGFDMAEKYQTTYHSPGKFNMHTGEILRKTPDGPEAPLYQDVFGDTLLELARRNKKIVGITPAMPTGSSLKTMMDAMPERTYDVGIAEQHAVTFSAGLATTGMIPFCNIYSTFMQRGYDQLIHDVAIQNLPVVFCLDRAGLVGSDGATHHGAFDMSYLRCIPNMTIASPLNEIELRNLMYTAQQDPKGPFAIRYPRGRGVTVDWKKPFQRIEIGRGRQMTDGKDLAILSIGPIGAEVSKAQAVLEKENISAAHYDMRFLKPLDRKLLDQVFTRFDKLITVEDGSIAGGLGSAILEYMVDNNYQARVVRLGIPDKFIEQGSQEQLWHDCGFDAEGIARSARNLVLSKIYTCAI
ncbi:MAG: 1-deoxy-D-xylulose-5-phosphate synthase [Bacteroidetes bacterium]|nr:MAG: 1-deoxy-D-xylulose-5-phosphate synthase [Bacteroidota bacterium]